MSDRGNLISRRLLAAELKQQRLAAGLTLEDLQRELLISTSKLSRLENAQGAPQWRDVRDLINFYELEGTEQADDLRRWVEESRKPPWWSKIGSTLPPVTAEYLAFESAASAITGYLSSYVPSLLQTRPYAVALITAVHGGPPDDLDAQVAVRMARQDVLTRPQGAVLVDFVIEESVLLRRVGSAEIMSQQLFRLADVSETWKNITVRVLPLRQGPLRATARGSFSVFSFPDGGYPDVAHREDEKYIADPGAVAGFKQGIEQIRAASLDPDRSVQEIRDAAAKYV